MEVNYHLNASNVYKKVFKKMNDFKLKLAF